MHHMQVAMVAGSWDEAGEVEKTAELFHVCSKCSNSLVWTWNI